jgi:hypothetical protein
MFYYKPFRAKVKTHDPCAQAKTGVGPLVRAKIQAEPEQSR